MSEQIPTQTPTTIMSREKIIENIIIDFHNASNPRLIPVFDIENHTINADIPPPIPGINNNYNFNLFPDNPELKFGIIQLKIADTPTLTQPQVLDTNNDMSGSMSDLCNDGKSKMQHAIHTLKNIVTALSKSSNNSIAMATYGFDDTVEEIFPDTKITKENAAELRTKMDELQPRGSTDLYKPLEMQSKRAQQRFARNPGIRQTNITMTDGQANVGKSTLYSDMANQVAPNCTNIFIGFGGDHNSVGLQQLADAQQNGSYFYIAEIEKAGLVFGEVIHQMLYTALTNVTIELTNAEIYNYKTNTWSTSLNIPSIVSEATKTYHIRSANPNETSARIIAQSAIHEETEASLISDDNTPLPTLISVETGEEEPRDLSIYMLRQRTQELMFKAHQYSIAQFGNNNNNNNNNDNNFEKQNKRNRENKKEIKNDLMKYLKFMRQFAKEQNLEDDEILNTLIDDITVVLQTFGGPKAAMYSSVRGNSQGCQTSNNVSYVAPEDMATHPRHPRHRRQQFGNTNNLQRQTANLAFGFGLSNQEQIIDEFNQDAEDAEDAEYINDTDNHFLTPPTLQRNITRSHTTPRQIALMRECSQGTHAEADLDVHKVTSFPEIESGAGSIFSI
jgi:hypothetical protein